MKHIRDLVRRMKRLSVSLVFVMLAAVVSNPSAQEPGLTPVDRPIPDFSLLGVDGTVYDTENLQGKTWLINFWAVWCAPCLEELPALNRAWSQLEKEDVGMLAINIGEEPDAISTFLTENQLAIDFPIVIGDKIRSLSNWSGRALPHTVVVSPAGRVVYEAVGPREWDEQRFIDAVIALNESKATASGTVSEMVTRFHNASSAMKAALVGGLFLLVAGLMYAIRRLSRKPVS